VLYYRLYKRMKQRFGYDAGAIVPLDYGLFAIIIPMIAGSIIGLMLQKFGIIGESIALFILVISVTAAAIYIQVCEKNDKEP
jgi:uncharacterized phage infection (PIP) family protein YhgE